MVEMEKWNGPPEKPAANTGDRSIRTVLFTDIVDSTGRAAELGDRDWRRLLDRHDKFIRDELGRCGGHEVETAGDGFMVD